MGEFKKRIETLFDIQAVSPSKRIYKDAAEMIDDLHNIRNAYWMLDMIEECRLKFVKADLGLNQEILAVPRDLFVEWFGTEEVT